MLQFGTIPPSDFLCFITNQTIYAIKAINHTFNIKLRKLKKNNVRNTDKLENLREREQVFKMSSVSVHAGVQCRAREQKSFVKIKPVPVVC